MPKIPERKILALSYIVAILMLAWFLIDNTYLALVTGIVITLTGILHIVRPPLQYFSSILYPKGYADGLYFWTQRILGVLLVIVGMFILLNYRITSTVQVGIMGIIFCGLTFVIAVIRYIFFPLKIDAKARRIILFIVVASLIFIAGFIWMIKLNEPFKMSLSGRIGTGIGILAYLIISLINRRTEAKKDEAENDNSDMYLDKT